MCCFFCLMHLFAYPMENTTAFKVKCQTKTQADGSKALFEEQATFTFTGSGFHFLLKPPEGV